MTLIKTNWKIRTHLEYIGLQLTATNVIRIKLQNEQELDYEKLVSSTKLHGATEGTARVEVFFSHNCQQKRFSSTFWKLIRKQFFTSLDSSLFADLLHVSEREGDQRDRPLLSRHLHRHHRRLHGRLGWLLRLHDLWGQSFFMEKHFKFLLLQVIELLIDLGGRLACPSKMWRWISDRISMLQPVQRQSIRIRNTMYVEVKLPVDNEINVKFCRVSLVIYPMVTPWQYEMILC